MSVQRAYDIALFPATQLKHPNIVRVVDFCVDSEYYYIVMELVSGGELLQKIGGKVRTRFHAPFTRRLSRNAACSPLVPRRKSTQRLRPIASSPRWLRRCGSATQKASCTAISRCVCPIYPHPSACSRASACSQPENILLSDKTDKAVIKLCDFGFCKTLKGNEATLQTRCGSPGYAWRCVRAVVVVS